MNKSGSESKSGLGIVGWILFILGIVLMRFSLLTGVLYGAFFLASFIIAIILMTRKRFGSGVTLLLATLIVAPIVGVTTFAFRASDALDEILDIDTPTSIHEGSEVDEELEYIDSVALYGLKAKYYTSLLAEKVPGVEFNLKNNGSRTLKKVEVIVYFKDKSGNVIHEKDFHPVSTYTLFGDDTPLKPNYIRAMPKAKFYEVENVPNEWKVGSVFAKITEIEFE